MLCAGLTAGLLLAASSATADPSIASKRAQAEAVIAQIRTLDSEIARAAEAWNYAKLELDRIDGELQTNGRHLQVARKSLTVAQTRVAQRLESLYVNGGNGGVVEILLGAESLDDLLGRLDVVDRVGKQDAKVLREVKVFRREVETRRARLRQARVDQARVVSERAEQKQSIEGRLAERQRLLASVKDEIARLEEAERRRQAVLAAQARARLAAQQAAAQRAALERQAAQEAPAAPAAASVSSSFAGSQTADQVAAAVAPPPDGSKASQVIAIAMRYLGVPYVWGGMSPSGFDCSGLTSYAFAQIGVSLPHHAASQFNYGTPVSRDQLQPGDLVFFDGLGHMGMYIGGGSFIHAPHTGDVVKISSLSDGWYASKWVGARRVL